ncbi:MAG TPA: response regulator [Rhizomicrobium sp.]|jgi:DNA-binding response OmpR family regulator
MDNQFVICVIDDDESVRQTVGRILRNAGHAVVEAKDGEMGLRVIERTLPAMIITDIVMPNREGIETIREAKQRFPTIPIIAISGGGRLGPDGFLELALKLGADDCLAKPFRPAELLDKVGRLLKPQAHAQVAVV